MVPGVDTQRDMPSLSSIEYLLAQFRESETVAWPMDLQHDQAGADAPEKSNGQTVPLYCHQPSTPQPVLDVPFDSAFIEREWCIRGCAEFGAPEAPGVELNSLDQESDKLTFVIGHLARDPALTTSIYETLVSASETSFVETQSLQSSPTLGSCASGMASAECTPLPSPAVPHKRRHPDFGQVESQDVSFTSTLSFQVMEDPNLDQAHKLLVRKYICDSVIVPTIDRANMLINMNKVGGRRTKRFTRNQLQRCSRLGQDVLNLVKDYCEDNVSASGDPLYNFDELSSTATQKAHRRRGRIELLMDVNKQRKLFHDYARATRFSANSVSALRKRYGETFFVVNPETRIGTMREGILFNEASDMLAFLLIISPRHELDESVAYRDHIKTLVSIMKKVEALSEKISETKLHKKPRQELPGQAAVATPHLE